MRPQKFNFEFVGDTLTPIDRPSVTVQACGRASLDKLAQEKFKGAMMVKVVLDVNEHTIGFQTIGSVQIGRHWRKMKDGTFHIQAELQKLKVFGNAYKAMELNEYKDPTLGTIHYFKIENKFLREKRVYKPNTTKNENRG